MNFRRQNMTSTDVRFWRLKSVPALKGLIQDNLRFLVGWTSEDYPANTKCWYNVSLVMDQRHRRWANIKPTFRQRFIFASQGRPHIEPALVQLFCETEWMTLTSFVFTELANTMKYGGGVLYNLVFTEWRHCVSQNEVWGRGSYITLFSPSDVTAFHRITRF